MYIKIQIGTLHLEMFYQDDSIGMYWFVAHRSIIRFEKSLKKYFKCAECGTRVRDKGDKLQLCDIHYEEFLNKMRDSLRS